MNNAGMESATGQGPLNVRVWKSEGAPKAVMQLVHGMAEHIDRYDEFAGFLARNGILVVGADTASHGKSRRANGAKGYFGENDGWNALVEDIRNIYLNIKADYNNVPYFLFGHSMGSFLVRTYASHYGEDMDGFIFCGTAGANPALPIAKLIAKREIKKNGPTAPSPTLNSLSFGSYNKAFKPNRTEFDWLSANEENVDRYVADPECGYVFTCGGFRDLFNGLCEIGSRDWAGKVAKRPIFVIAGAQDPVGANGKGPRQVAAALTESGHDVTLKIYENMRHEIHNELGRAEIYKDVLAFINIHC